MSALSEKTPHLFMWKTANMFYITNHSSVTYPVFVVEIERIKYRALIDTGVRSSYASSNVIKKLKKNKIRKECKRIETILHSHIKKVETFNLEIRNINQEFKFNVQVINQKRRFFWKYRILSPERYNPKWYQYLKRFTSVRHHWGARLH